MDWSIIEKITNHPVFVTVMGVAAFLGSALLFLSKTSFGKKAIAKLTELTNGVSRDVASVKGDVKNALDTVQTMKNEIVEFKKEVVSDVKVYFNQLEFFEQGMYKIVSQIPNAKVQEQLKVFYSEWNEKKKAIQEFVGGSFNQLDEQLKELEEKKNSEIANLRSEIDKLKDLVELSLKVKETTENGERKETINEETDKE